MNNVKETDLLRRRNITLSQELEEAKGKYDQLENLNSESAKKAKALIVELEAIRMEWIDVINDIHEKQAEIDQLLHTLRQMRDIMEEPKPKESRPRRFLSRLRKDTHNEQT